MRDLFFFCRYDLIFFKVAFFHNNDWMTTFGMDFAMEPLTGDRPNDPDRVPHYFVVIAKRDNLLVRKIYIFV